MLTIEQATNAMAAGIPVMHGGMTYLRIIGVSKVLTRHNQVIPSITLEERGKRAIFHARPEDVTIHGIVEGRRYWFDGDDLRSEADVE